MRKTQKGQKVKLKQTHREQVLQNTTGSIHTKTTKKNGSLINNKEEKHSSCIKKQHKSTKKIKDRKHTEQKSHTWQKLLCWRWRYWYFDSLYTVLKMFKSVSCPSCLNGTLICDLQTSLLPELMPLWPRWLCNVLDEWVLTSDSLHAFFYIFQIKKLQNCVTLWWCDLS